MHTTFFGLTGEDFKPEINMLKKKDFRNINVANLLAHPLGWICTISWILLCMIIIVIFEEKCLDLSHIFKVPEIDDKPLIAHHETMFSDSKFHNRKIKEKYRSIIEWKVFKQDEEQLHSLRLEFWHLYKLAIRNDHVC